MVLGGQDAWRSGPAFRNLHLSWQALPGFRPAVAIFGVYLIADWFLKPAAAPMGITSANFHASKPEEIGENPTMDFKFGGGGH